jgi:hypothetical protein
VRAYWARQFALVDSRVEPTGVERRGDGVVIVEVHQVVHDLQAALLSDTVVRHEYTFRDGLIARMDVLEP